MNSVNDDLYEIEEDDEPAAKRRKLGNSGTPNEGITWFGSSYVGPGNLLVNEEGEFIGNALPTSDIDKVAFQHDADYWNATDVSKDAIWELDKKAIDGALDVSDPYLGNIATVVGLYVKRGADLLHGFVTGSDTSIYPSVPNTSGKHFDPSPYINGTVDQSNQNVVKRQAPDTTANGIDDEDESSSGDDGMATKRGADSSGGDGSHDSKKNKISQVPGSGAEIGGDADTGNPSAENLVVPKPISHNGGFTMVFRKVHTLISYGCAWHVIKDEFSDKVSLGTTSLMNIPVDKIWWYMSPSEFKNLPIGAICTEVSTKVVMKNPRTAFETNTTGSTLATYNQDKTLVVAHDLNKKTRGVNKRYNFTNSAEPMIPVSAQNPLVMDIEIIHHMYAQYWKDAKPNFNAGFNLPSSYLNLPIMYNSYYTMVSNEPGGCFGWPRLNEHITKVDASFTVGTTVATHNYKPRCGLLTPPIMPIMDAYVNMRYPEEKSFSILGKNTLTPGHERHYEKNGNEQYYQELKVKTLDQTEWTRIFQNERYFRTIDVGQYIRKESDHDFSSQVQPSLHVGVYPVHKLTTSTNSIVPQNFTDIECAWVCTAEMTVHFGCPASRTAFDRYHVNWEDRWVIPNERFNTNCYLRDDLSLIHGKFVTPSDVSQVTVKEGEVLREKNRDATNVKLTSFRDSVSTNQDITDKITTTTVLPAYTTNKQNVEVSSGVKRVYKPPPDSQTQFIEAKRRILDNKNSNLQYNTDGNVDVDVITSQDTPHSRRIRVTDHNKPAIQSFVYRPDEPISWDEEVYIHHLPSNIDPEEAKREEFINYDSPDWWPDPTRFRNYSMFLQFCYKLTHYRISKNIPIQNQPVDFLTRKKK